MTQKQLNMNPQIPAILNAIKNNNDSMLALARAVLSCPSVESSSSVSRAFSSGLFDGMLLTRSYKRKVDSQTKFVMEELTSLCHDVVREHQLDIARSDEVNIRDNIWGRSGIMVDGILSKPDIDLLRTSWSAIPETTLKAQQDL
ncbi:hypothetical protein BDB00DRAFT_868403 [Zychaea mexicana]|uniref:uncharacterized protein n=1 Tax=Zychaea mexicana TaxID=64656 RepID=UPI0022FDD93E|nr:uncharacterized protein BDB00DRAFT_868403 [Zychaea mexicana]KAI9497360.1 hypothetical protein BDB00DRAFT_868403 [Zychaea mexicana]